MPETVYHMVHYREYTGHQPDKDSTLESLLRDRLSTVGLSGLPRWESIADRLQEGIDEQGYDVVLNRVADLSSAVFGEMCLIHRDGVQALLNLTAERTQLSQLTMAEVYSLTESGAPKGTRYVRGLAYFLAVGQHLFYIRNQALTAGILESYLGWILKLQPGGFSSDKGVSFESRFDRSVVGSDIGEIKALHVSGPSFPQMRIEPTNDAQTRERKITRRIADRTIEFAKAFEIASLILGPTQAKSLAESLGPKERLAVDASVKIKGSRTEQSKAKLKSIASELDSLTDGKITVEGKGGKIIDNDIILRTSMPFNKIESGKSLLDFDNVADQLQTVYLRFVEDDLIQA